MAAKLSAPKPAKSLIPPDDSMWQKYSPHYEAPLAGATSLFLHGTILGMLAIGGMAFLWAAREEASRPPRMEVVTVEGDGAGLEGGGAAPGLPGDPDAGGPKRTEQVTPADQPTPLDHGLPRFLPEPPPLDVGPIIDDSKAPLSSDVAIDLERLAKDANDAAKKPLKATPPLTGSGGKKPGPAGTGNPKGKGGLGGSGDGTGTGGKKGPGTGSGGMGGRKATDQEIYAWRWNFDLSGNAKEHARKLAAIGVDIAVEDPRGQVWFITDLNRRPAELKRGVLPDPKVVVGWRNTRGDSIAALAQELQLPFTPKFVQMLLPKEREQKMAQIEKAFADSQRRGLSTVRKTWFEFRFRNGTYEPVAVRLE